MYMKQGLEKIKIRHHAAGEECQQIRIKIA